MLGRKDIRRDWSVLRFWEVRGIGERAKEEDEEGGSEEGLEPVSSESEREPDSELEGSESAESELDDEASLLLEEEESVSVSAKLARNGMGMAGRLSSRLEDEGSSLSELDISSLSLGESSSSDDSSREGIESSEPEAAEVWEDALLEEEAMRVGELDGIVPAKVSVSLVWWRVNAWRLVRLPLFDLLGSWG